jgi:hypothetical protein
MLRLGRRLRVTYNVEIKQAQQQRETLYPRVTYNVEIKQA